MATTTDWQYEVLRWTKINPKPVTEDLNSYMARCIEHFVTGVYDDGVADGERSARMEHYDKDADGQ